MNRIKNFTRNLAANYIQLAMTVVYSLVSVPLILHWLPKAEFGMWALVTQLASYVSLIDVGMTSAISRYLVDYKDQRKGGEYGSLIKTAWLVSLVQAAIVLGAALALSPIMATVMKIPAEDREAFIVLLRVQGALTAAGFCFRPLSLTLYAHQRMDIQAASEIMNLLAGLGLLWFFLFNQCGIYSFIYANTCCLLVGPVYLFWKCKRLDLLPRAGDWGRASARIFKELFGYGKDVFLMGLGSQLVTASQTIIVSRALGLEVAAVWAVGIKLFNLVLALMWRPYGAAMPGLYELTARGENERLKNRFRQMVVLTCSLGVFFSVSFALCNGAFMHVWTNGKIAWQPLNDLLLGVWLFLLSMQTTHCNFVNVVKHIGGMRYIYFLEGCCFVAAGLLVGPHLGTPGIIGCSIVCTALFSYQYSLRRSQRYFHLNLKELAIKWIRPCLKMAAFFVPIGALVWFSTHSLSPMARLAVNGIACVLLGGLLLIRIGLSREMIHETTLRLPRAVSKLLQLLGPVKA